MQGSPGSAEVGEMAQGLLATGTDGTLFDSGASLREAAAARVAAHRNRRVGVQAMDAARDEALRQEQARIARESRHGVAKVRDAVRARYEHSQSYREFLAAEAERTMQQAQAEAEVAARNAKAIADAQMQLLEELRQESFEAAAPAMTAFEEERGGFEWAEAAPAISLVEEPASRSTHESWEHSGDLFAEPEPPVREISTGGLTVRLYEDVPPLPAPWEMKARSRVMLDDAAQASEELAELEQEIAFRRAPEFEDHILEALPLPANLIEFPRELVAARRARPRLAWKACCAKSWRRSRSCGSSRCSRSRFRRSRWGRRRLPPRLQGGRACCWMRRA